MPVPDGVVFLAAHPGQGEVMLHGIDPSVIDEADPLAADPELDLFDLRNGFREPPESSATPRSSWPGTGRLSGSACPPRQPRPALGRAPGGRPGAVQEDR